MMPLKTVQHLLLSLVILSALACMPLTAAAQGRINIAYVEWASEVASTHLVQVVLEQAGYDVRITPVSAAAMWQAVGSGDYDAMVAAWLPTTHQDYLERVQDSVEDLGPNLSGTRIGLVVPSYVEIDSIDEISAHAALFNGRIVGIDPGAGLMRATEKVIDAYELDGIRLIEGSDATMTAVLQDSIRRNEWVIVTGWTPHWKFGRWDLKYLEDPQGIYGGEEQIHTIVRNTLKDDMPEAYAILQRFSWTTEQMSELMVMNEEGGNPYDNAKLFAEQNPALMASWLQD